ncbi:ABC transporter permease [Peptostreptococcaceae bacterium AGR-M142]
MLKLIKLNLIKEFWEIMNNKTKLLILFIFNLIIFNLVYFKIVKNIAEDIVDIQYILILILIFYIIMNAFSYVGNITIRELNAGNIENLILSPHGLLKITISRILTNLIKTLIIVLSIIYFFYFFFQISIDSKFYLFIFIIFLGSFSLYGIGLIISSISFFSKEIQMLSGIFKIIILYLILKIEQPNILIPFSHAKFFIFNLFFENNSISEFDTLFIISFITNSVLYFLIGVKFFKKIEYIALKTGAFLQN